MGESRHRSTRSRRPWLAEATGSTSRPPTSSRSAWASGSAARSTALASPGTGAPGTVVVKLPGARRGGRVHLDDAAHVHREAGFFAELARRRAAAGPRVPPPRRRPRDEPVRARDGGHRRRCGSSTRSRAWRSPTPSGRSTAWPRGTRPGGGGPLALAERGPHGEPRRRDLQGRAADGVRRGVGEARRGARRPRGDPGGGAPLDWRHARAARRAGRGADDDVHGDFRADNLFFERRRLRGGGRLPAHRHRARRLRPGVLHHPEPHRPRRLRARAGPVRPLDAALEAAGVPEADLATAWEDYRRAALFCLVYPVVAWRGMDAGDPRQVRPGHHDARALRPGGRRAGPHRPALDAGRLRRTARAGGLRWRPATPGSRASPAHL